MSGFEGGYINISLPVHNRAQYSTRRLWNVFWEEQVIVFIINYIHPDHYTRTLNNFWVRGNHHRSSVTLQGDGFREVSRLIEGEKLNVIFRSPKPKRGHWGGTKTDKYSKIVFFFQCSRHSSFRVEKHRAWFG